MIKLNTPIRTEVDEDFLWTYPISVVTPVA